MEVKEEEEVNIGEGGNGTEIRGELPFSIKNSRTGGCRSRLNRSYEISFRPITDALFVRILPREFLHASKQAFVVELKFLRWGYRLNKNDIHGVGDPT